jgi:type IV fimbrial biogenesis protein FimT
VTGNRRRQGSVRGRSAGFTLLELLMTIVIAGVLLTLAVPSFIDTIRNNRILASANNLISGVNTARAEAIRRSRMVSICPSADGASCSTDWSAGWMVYVEKDVVKAGDAPNIDTILQVNDAVTKTSVARTAGTKDYIRFTSRGLPEEAFTLQVKPQTCKSGYQIRIVSVGAAGRASANKSTCP